MAQAIEQTEYQKADAALREAAIETNRLRNVWAADAEKLVPLRLEVNRLAGLAKAQTAEKSTLAEIRSAREQLLKVATKLRKLADAEAEILEQHGQAVEILEVKWEARSKQEAGIKVGIDASLRRMGVSRAALPTIAADAANQAEAEITQLAEKGI